MILQWPWALLCGVSVPLLLMLYWLRRRLRHRRVPSLLMWSQQRPRMTAGRRWQRWHSSRLFWLELALLMLLALAAAGPRWLGNAQEPLYVVLDDSLSMRAGGDDSPRARAAAALSAWLEDDPRRSVHWLLAGRRVQLLAAEPRDSHRAEVPPAEWLRGRWKCLAPSAELAKGIAQALELGGPAAHILVLTDHLPPESVDTSRIRWWSFGMPRPNVGIVAAGRRNDGDLDHVMLEVRNASSQPVRTGLQLRWGVAASAEVSHGPGMTAAPVVELELAAGESRRQRWQVPRGSAVDVTLPDDALAADNRVVLLGESRPRVKVALEMEPGQRRDLLSRTLHSTALAELVPTSSPEVDLYIRVGDARREVAAAASAGAWHRDSRHRDSTSSGDSGTASARSERRSKSAWHLWMSPSSVTAQPFVGPFIVDHHHPLSEGLALDGVVWGAAPSLRVADLPPSDRPVISAGDVPLLIDHGRASGERHLLLRWQWKLSNLQRTPNWPALWWNLLAACAEDRPGVEPINGRLGMPFEWHAPSSQEQAVLRSPGGGRREVAPGIVESDGLELGVHTLEWDGERQAFAVNALNVEESDLRRAAAGRLGSWRPQRLATPMQHRLEPYLLLVALLLSMLHLVWSWAGDGAAVRDAG